MNIDELWDAYFEVESSPDPLKRLEVLLQCANQTEDIGLTRLAEYQIALALSKGEGIPQDQDGAGR